MRRVSNISLTCAGAVLSALLASPAFAACKQPSGDYVGSGAGPIFYQGLTALSGRTEVWILTFPTPTAQGRAMIRAKSHPRPGVTTDYYSLYQVTDVAIPTIALASTSPNPASTTVWDPATCTGSIRVRGTGTANIKWMPSGETADYSTDQTFIYTSANSGSVVTLSLVGQSGPFSQLFNIRLEKQ